MELNKQLQQKIGELIGKDYFKLEFGCKTTDGVIVGQEYNPVWKCETALVTIDWLNRTYIPFGELIILGQEPTLNDVLLAIEKNRKRDGKEYLICFDGWVVEYNRITDKQIRCFKIELEKSIFNQSPEVKQQLLDLIIK